MTTAEMTSSREALAGAARVLAGLDPDFASEANGVGYSQADGWLGHSIARLPLDSWTAEVERTAWVMLRKYRRQLSTFGIDFDAIPEPEVVGDDQLSRKAARSYIWDAGGGRRRAGQTGITLNDQEFVIRFPYSAENVKRVKSIPGRRWDAGEKRWTAPVSSALYVARFARTVGIPATDEVTRNLLESEDDGQVPAVTDKLEERRITLGDDGLLTVRFPFDASIVADMQMIPGARWDRPNVRWTVPSAEAPALLEVARRHKFKAPAAVHQLVVTEATEWEQRIEASQALEADFHVDGLGATLRPFQKAGVRYAAERRRTFLGDEMGLGKTPQALATLQHLDSFPAVVVVPSGRGKILRKWAAEVEFWLPGRSFTVLSNSAERIRYRPLHGGGRRTVEANRLDADVIITNYDLLPRWLKTERDADGNEIKENRQVVREATGLLRDVIEKVRPKAVIFDESHYLKNLKAARTVGCLLLAEGAVRFPIRERVYEGPSVAADGVALNLTGTPALNRVVELKEQLRLIGRLRDFGGSSYFTRTYCDGHMGEFGYDSSGATNLDSLHSRLRAICYLRRIKKDVMPELGEPQRETMQVDLSNRKEYDKAQADFIAWIKEQVKRDPGLISDLSQLDPDEIDEALDQAADEAARRALRAEALVRIGNLRRLSGLGKVDEIAEWISEALDSSTGKWIVFAHHKAVQDELYDRFPGAARISSNDSAAAAEDHVHAFQTDDSVRVMIASLSMAREGINLTAGENIVFAELPWRPGDIDQAEGRAYGRMDNPHGVNTYFMVAEGSIDEYMADMVDEKRAVVDQVNSGEVGASGRGVMAGLIGRLLDADGR